MDRVTLKAGPVTVDLLKGCRVAARPETGQAFEPDSLAAWASIVRPGEVALDIGAYTGLYAIAAAKLGATVEAFEPLPVALARLMRNRLLNGVRITAHPYAISDRAGKQRFSFDGRVNITSGGSLVSAGAHTGAILVEVKRLDDLAFPGRVAAIKIDTERNELRVLRGALTLIERDRPALLVEALEARTVSDVGAILAKGRNVPLPYRFAGLLDGRNALMVPA